METLTVPPLSPSPLVSVMIVNYNYERFLPAAIESVLAQTYQHFELIICDDGSTDNSRAVITSYASRDRRIRPIFKENAAVAAALNDTYGASTGEVIAMLDADDMFRPHKLERVVERLRPGGRVGMVMDTLTTVDAGGRPVGKLAEFSRYDRGELRETILRTGGTFSAAPTSAITFRRACAERVFPIPEKQFRTEADLYMRTVAALFYSVEVIDEPLTVYRLHGSNVTASTRVDLNWCAKVASGAERIHAVLSELARKHGWSVCPLEDSLAFCEMQLVHHCLAGAPARAAIRSSRKLNRAAAAVLTPDRRKTRAKAALLTLAAVIPQRLGRKLLEQIYQPSPMKASLGRVFRKITQRPTHSQ